MFSLARRSDIQLRGFKFCGIESPPTAGHARYFEAGPATGTIVICWESPEKNPVVKYLHRRVLLLLEKIVRETQDALMWSVLPSEETENS